MDGVGAKTLKKSASAIGSMNILGPITMDAIPLCWSKIPEFMHIIKAIRLCYGPYNTHCDLKFNTSDVFLQIHELAI